MKGLKRIFLFTFCFLTGLVLVSCGGTNTPEVPVTK